MALRESLAQFEQAFVEETYAHREQREAVERQVAARADERRRAKVHRHGSLRFAVLIGTAVLVTVAMFETLYIVMG
jgi:hypothetical protein